MQLTVEPNYYNKSALGGKHPRYSYDANIIPFTQRNHINVISFRGADEAFDYQAHLAKNLQKVGRLKRWFWNGTTQAEQMTVREAVAFERQRYERLNQQVRQREEDLTQREEASTARIQASDEGIRQREAEWIARIEAGNADIEARTEFVRLAEIEFEERQTKVDSELQAKIEDCDAKIERDLAECSRAIDEARQELEKAEAESNTRIRNIEAASKARITASEQALKEAADETQASIEAAKAEFEAYKLSKEQELAKVEKESEDKVSRRYKVIADAEKESEDRIRKKESTVEGKLAEAKRIRDEGLEMKKNAFEIALREAEAEIKAKRLAAEQAIKAEIKDAQSRIQFEEEEFRAYKARKEQEIANLERESNERIQKKESIVDRKLADARRIKDEGFVSKDEALKIRTDAVRLRKEAIGVRERVIYLETWECDDTKRRKVESLKRREDELKEREASVDEQEKDLTRERKKLTRGLKTSEGKVEFLQTKNDVLIQLVEQLTQKGFGKIAGREEQKAYFMQHLINPVLLEQTGTTMNNIPSGFLLFGPNGNGKSTFIQAVAEQAGCRLVKLEEERDPVKNLEKLQEVAEVAEEEFKKDRKRTIVQVEASSLKTCERRQKGFAVAADEKASKAYRTNLITALSKKYHTTLIMTAEDIEGMDDLLQNFPHKAILMPVDKAEAAAMLEHYARLYADTDVDYSELAKLLMSRQRDKAFSSSKIKEAIQNIIHANDFSGRITQESLTEAIKALTHDISKKALETFLQQKRRIFSR